MVVVVVVGKSGERLWAFMGVEGAGSSEVAQVDSGDI